MSRDGRTLYVVISRFVRFDGWQNTHAAPLLGKCRFAARGRLKPAPTEAHSDFLNSSFFSHDIRSSEFTGKGLILPLPLHSNHFEYEQHTWSLAN